MSRVPPTSAPSDRKALRPGLRLYLRPLLRRRPVPSGVSIPWRAIRKWSPRASARRRGGSLLLSKSRAMGKTQPGGLGRKWWSAKPGGVGALDADRPVAASGLFAPEEEGGDDDQHQADELPAPRQRL